MLSIPMASFALKVNDWANKYALRKLQQDFKHNVIRELIAFIDQDLYYDPQIKKNHNSRLASAFMNSCLSKFISSSYLSKDQIYGEFNGLSFNFGKLIVGEEEKSSFRGLFFVMEQPKLSDAVTLLYPRTSTEDQPRSTSKYKRAKLEDPVFERMFNVYTTDQVGARMQLTPLVMDEFKRIRDLYSLVPHVCFKGNCLYIAFPSNYHWLDASFKKDLDLYTMRHYIEQILSILELPRAFCLASPIGMD